MKTIKTILTNLALIVVAPFALLFLLFWMNLGMGWWEKLTGKKAWNPK